MSMNNHDLILIKIAVEVDGRPGFRLEAPYYPAVLHRMVSVYLRQMIQPRHLDDAEYIQNVLSRPVAELPEFAVCDFDADFRLGELITLLAIHETRDALHPIDDDTMRIYPAWQPKHQKPALESATGKGSWDGFLVGVPKTDASGAPALVPIEIKSTARDPQVPVAGTPEEQLEETMARFAQYFQDPGTISCVLLYPYTSEREYVLDLQRTASSIRQHVSDRSTGVVCLITFVERDREVAVEIICAFITDDIDMMNDDNHHQWLRKVIF